jgi:hypothetical protein
VKPLDQHRQRRPPSGTVARTIAPDDLVKGQFVAVLRETNEYPSFFWMDEDLGSGERCEPVRMTVLPSSPGLPLKVKAICLPFVVVKPFKSPPITLDVRSVELVELSAEYVRAARKVRRTKP